MNRHFILGLSVAVAVAAAARAQQAGSLRGVALDKDFDAPLANATVLIVETGEKVQSTDQGTWVFPQVRPGRYTVVASKEGYVRTVRGDVMVSAGQLTELRLELAGDYTDLEEFVVQDALNLGSGSEAQLLDMRLDSPALMDSISTQLMSRAGTNNAADALRLVPGASATADGKSAVIRGLPDRYISSQLNGITLPTADKDKRAVELDQFPAEVIQSLQVSKTFTPDQQGNASGGAVNVVLRGVPEEPFFMRYRASTTYNSQFTGKQGFLQRGDSHLHAFGKNGGQFSQQELGTNWSGDVGVDQGVAPPEYRGSLATGGRFDIGDGWRAGGFVNVFYLRDQGYYANGRDDQWWALRARDPLSPQFNQASPQSGEFYTSLFDVKQGRQSAQWGGLATVGIESDDHAFTFTWLNTQGAEDTATLAEDTRGKEYFFPGHDPSQPSTPGNQEFLGAPWLRLQTLNYVERKTDTMQLAGRHRYDLYGAEADKAEIDWSVSRSSALRDQPDRRQFASAWSPTGTYLQYKPAAQFALGNLQRVFEKIKEDSDQVATNLKMPFRGVADEKGYFKVGFFHDRVVRTFDQDTFSNFNDPTQFYNGQFDQLDWSDVWNFENHPITASETDVDYRGSQRVGGTYVMADIPLAERLHLVGGVRRESTGISIINSPEANAYWVPPDQFGIATLAPGDGDVSLSKQNWLPSLGLSYEPVEHVVLRSSYSETIARPTFKELTPIFQQEYLGGPIFVGNPGLQLSDVKNYDLRADYTPYEGTLFSVSWFRKDIKNPIEYIERQALYTFITADNFPSGKMQGYEVELRQGIGQLWAPLDGLSLGGNATFIQASVQLPDDEIARFEALQGFKPAEARDMTNTPEYLWNIYGTYDFAPTRTNVGLFYTVTGDTLIRGPGPSNDFFVPATYITRFENLNLTIQQNLAPGLTLSFAARNLTNALRREVYRSDYHDDVTRRSRTDGIDFSLAIGGEIRF